MFFDNTTFTKLLSNAKYNDEIYQKLLSLSNNDLIIINN